MDRLICTSKNIPWLEWVSRMCRRTRGTLLRGGSKFESFCLNEKGTTRYLLLARCPLFFLFSFHLNLLISFRSCFPDCLERRVSYSALLCCRVKWIGQTTCSLSFGDICCSQELSWARKIPLLLTPTEPSMRPSNQMRLIDLNSFPSIHSRARESKSLSCCVLL